MVSLGPAPFGAAGDGRITSNLQKYPPPLQSLTRFAAPNPPEPVLYFQSIEHLGHPRPAAKRVGRTKEKMPKRTRQGTENKKETKKNEPTKPGFPGARMLNVTFPPGSTTSVRVFIAMVRCNSLADLVRWRDSAISESCPASALSALAPPAFPPPQRFLAAESR